MDAMSNLKFSFPGKVKSLPLGYDKSASRFTRGVVMRPFLQFLLVVAFTSSVDADDSTMGWTTYSPRDEIKPAL